MDNAACNLEDAKLKNINDGSDELQSISAVFFH